MAIKAVSQLPDPIQPLSDNDLLFLTQYDADNEQYVSVQLSLGDLKDWINVGAPEPISCDGATYKIYFTDFSPFGSWEVFIDGVSLPTPGGSQIGAISNAINNLNNGLQSGNDGWWRVENHDTVNHRFRLVPNGGDTSYTLDEANSTPCFQENPDGSIEFCLAPLALCESMGFQSQDVDLPPANYTFEYQVNGESRTYSYLAENVISVGSLFSYLLSEDLSPVVMVGSGGGMGHFQFIYATGFAIYAAQGDGDPQTIVITSLKQDGIEVLSDVLGENNITLHACGQQNFIGV